MRPVNPAGPQRRARVAARASRGRSRARSTLRTGASAGLHRLARAHDALRPPRPGVVVLLYHRVGGRTPSAVDLPAAQFADQVAAVAGRAAPLDDALQWLDGGTGPAPVVVTFDDGTADVIDEALPTLVDHGVPMLLYLATRFVEDRADFPGYGRPTSWRALADGLSTGCLEIGSHTHSHALLDRIDPGAVAEELDRSISLIEDNLGVTPRHFAYPKGLPGHAEAQRAVRSRFASAAVGGTRANEAGRTDPWALARSPVQVIDDESRFAAKLAGGLRLEDDVRRVANRLRYRGLTT